MKNKFIPITTSLLLASILVKATDAISRNAVLSKTVVNAPVEIEQSAGFMSLQATIDRAITNDPWLKLSYSKQRAVEYKSTAVDKLPDPKISLTLANVPTDSWSMSQEGMSQVKVGVSQMFTRGDSLALKAKQFEIQASEFPFLRADRTAKVTSMVSELWLDAYAAQQTIALIKQDWALFEQIAEVAKANYSSALGSARQQDVIRAQLEIIQLEDRLMSQQQKLDANLARLKEWVGFNQINGTATAKPFISMNTPDSLTQGHYTKKQLVEVIQRHPALKAFDVKERKLRTLTQIEKQAFKPRWGVNASYGHRNAMQNGNDRADLFSVGVSLEVPLFSQNEVEAKVSASVAESEAVKTQKTLVTRQMLAQLEHELANLTRLIQRKELYQNQLLTQVREQAEAYLSAYTNDDGDFAEVVRARIAQLNANIAALNIEVELLKTKARINYYFTDSSAQEASTNAK